MTSRPAVQLTPAAPTSNIRLAGVLLAVALCLLGLAAPSAEAAFPGQNGEIAFQRTASGNDEIFTMSPDGTLQTNRSNNAARDTDPAFSADGSRIAFVSERDGNAEIYAMNADGSAQTRLTNNAAADTNPAFSRDGKRIVFVSNRDGGNAEIYAMDSVDTGADGNGDNLARLTTSTRTESGPVFSPDGSKIAFAGRLASVGGLSVMNANGTGETAVTSNSSDANPDFSPDGSKLVFDNARAEVYTIKVDGTQRTNVSNHAAEDFEPAFSPDGTKIAFTRQAPLSVGTAAPRGIYTMNADGSEQTYRSLTPFQNSNPDRAPSWGVTPASADKAPPETTISSGPTGTTNDTTPSFEFSSSEPKSSFECRVDAAAFAPCESPHTTAQLSDGQHTFEVRATDVAGNTDPSPASRAFTVDTAGSSDTTPPQTTIDSGPSDPTKENTATFTFSSDEAGSTFQCRVDSQPFAPCSSSSSHTTAQLGDGTHTFQVRATDAAGNADPTPASRTFTVDTAAPETTISSGPPATSNDKSPSFSYTSSEPDGATFQCKLDGPGPTTGSYADCPSPKAYSNLADGDYVFSVKATDAAGNEEATPEQRSFTVDSSAPPSDTTPPQTTISSGPPATTADRTPTFAFSSSEAGSTFSCRVDGGAYASCRSPHTTAALSPGRHSFAVAATDSAGNTDPTPATRTFTVSAPPASPRRPAAPPARPPAPDASDPLISGLSFSPGRFRAARRGPSIAAKGARVSYRLSESARVTFRVERALAGRRAGRRCVRPRRSNRRARRCTRYQTLRGSFSHQGQAGANTLRFSGRVGGRRLRPGRYRLRAVASDAAGNRSKPGRKGFRIRR